MKKLITITTLIIFLFPFLTEGQPKEDTFQNLVPNAGFEEFAATPIGWFYKGQHFTNVVRYWSAATGASPDVFGPKVRVPIHWQEKDFGKQTPRRGKAMAGITTYGCDNGKPHCREYLQIQLLESLVEGQEYYLEMWVTHLPKSLQVNNIGAYFSKEKISLKTDVLIDKKPQVNATKILDGANKKWVKVVGKFKATNTADYLIIGNFFPDSLTNFRSVSPESFNYAYYYIDDILLKKEKPILPTPLPPDDLSLVKIEKGKIIQLRNIFFETDRAELLPRSYTELKKLYQLLVDHPNMRIEIRGHTDIRGHQDYNADLSQRRAKAVVDYLEKKGIPYNRTLYKGFGSTLPVASNETQEGRQLNRRVEFIILSE